MYKGFKSLSRRKAVLVESLKKAASVLRGSNATEPLDHILKYPIFTQ